MRTKSNLERGFKTRAEKQAAELRERLKIPLSERICCAALAKELRVTMVSLSEMRGETSDPSHIEYLLTRGTIFSAATIVEEPVRLLVYNCGHTQERQRNSMAHEFSHLLLGHSPRLFLGKGECRDWDAKEEEEADYLAGALLVPREGLLYFLRSGEIEENGPRHFGVSPELFRWRRNSCVPKKR